MPALSTSLARASGSFHKVRRITCTLKQALALLTLERDVAGVIQCARIALSQGSETERAVAVSALMVVGGQEASELRDELVRVLGWGSDCRQLKVEEAV